MARGWDQAIQGETGGRYFMETGVVELGPIHPPPTQEPSRKNKRKSCS